jgi:uncharacterized protein YjbJ (UPF0337 family)
LTDWGSKPCATLRDTQNRYKRENVNDFFSAPLAHIRLDAAALICNTINSDQFSKAQSLILAIHKILRDSDAGRRPRRHVIQRQGENQMNPSTKDEIKGTFHEVKGKIKETAGKVTNNPNLEGEGKAEQTTGKVEKKVGQIERVLEK